MTFSLSKDSQFVLWQPLPDRRRCSIHPLNGSVKIAVSCSHSRNCARLTSPLIGTCLNIGTWLPHVFLSVWKSNEKRWFELNITWTLLLQPNKEVSVEKSFRLSEEDSAKPKLSETRKVNYQCHDRYTCWTTHTAHCLSIAGSTRYLALSFDFLRCVNIHFTSISDTICSWAHYDKHPTWRVWGVVEILFRLMFSR